MLKINRFDLLVSFYIFCLIAAEVMGSKTFPLLNLSWLHLNASVAIFVVPFLYSVTDVVTEVYGKERARSLIRSGIVMVFLLMLFSLFVTVLPPSARFAASEAAYDDIFTKSARISAASLTALAVAAFLDVYIFSRLRAAMHRKALWFRNNLSNFTSQLVDTVVFITLAFYSFGRPFGDNASFLIGIIVPYWLLKCGMSVIETPLVYLGVKWLKGGKKTT